MRCARRLLSFAVTTHAIGFCDALNKIRSQIYVSVTMISSVLAVPGRVRGITVLTDNEKKLFSKEIILPVLIVPPKSVSRIIGCTAIANRTVARFCNKIKPVINMPSGDEKGIVFCPEKIDNEARVSVLKIVDDITDSSVRFDSYSLTMHYDDWPVKSCISAILPKGLEFGGFAQIGHIVHVNLREELLPYKKVIGQILFDKIASCKTVVNKLDAIGHKYRTFELDLLAGEANYETEVHEDKLRYQLNFKQVFYNPRLSTEHKRIVKKIGKRSILYDCCAGIGPFVLPAVRNGAHHVLANDLNPDCIEYMKRNLKLNRLSAERLKMYNMDAALFISTALADDLANEFKNFNTTASECNENNPTDAHVLMNLPGMSLQFLPHFRGCLHNKGISSDSLQFPLYVHCHFFVKAPEDVEDNWYKEEARNLVRASLGIMELDFVEVKFVRDVAGRKKMFCASFQLPDKYLLEPSASKTAACADDSRTITENDELEFGQKSIKGEPFHLSPEAKRKKLEQPSVQ